MNAARPYEQEAHDRDEVADAEATAQTQAGMFHEQFPAEQIVEYTFSNQQMEMINQRNSVAENAIEGQRSMLMSEAFAEVQHCDDVNGQLEILN